MEMTLEELIIGHYEEALTTEQERELNTLISHDTNAKSMFEEYGKVESLMMEDVAETNTDDRLDKAVLAAAISAGAATVISGGTQTASWLTGKMAMVGGAVVAGGVATAVYFGLFKGKEDDSPKIQTPPPAVNIAPVQNSNTPAAPATEPVAQPLKTSNESSLNKKITTPKLKQNSIPKVDAKPKIKKKQHFKLNDNPDATIETEGIKTR